MRIIEFFRAEVNAVANDKEKKYIKKMYAYEITDFVVSALEEKQKEINFPKMLQRNYTTEKGWYEFETECCFTNQQGWGRADYVREVEITDKIAEVLKGKISEFVGQITEAVKKQDERDAYKNKWNADLWNKVSTFSQLTVSDSKREGKHIIFKGYKITLWETADYDWDYYAKSYGHPKKTVECREVLFYKKGKTKRVEISSFRTTDIIKGVADFFKIPFAPKNRMQTNPFFVVTKIKDTSKYSIYTQTFVGEVVAYVVSDGKITYHDDTKKAAIEGWKKKAALAQEKKEIKAGLRFTAAQLHEDYGFCWDGIHEFADACGLDATKSYTQKELRTAFNKSPERRTLLIKYKSELSQIL